MVVAAILAIPHLHGVILETYGSGNAPTEDWLIC
jgi:L-asparaginase